ncbi:MAG: hypothetical protein J5J00_08025 [Deltaproteobacteria bacterium]|nr:hypothetical protein [Deltaproteobacteria bacterium]
MKKPNLKSLKLNEVETKHIRSNMAKQKSVKITININADTLGKLRAIADESGIPYQRLINRTLTESLAGQNHNSERIERIEKELRALKKKLVA